MCLIGGCGDFYAITIASPAFKNLSTLKQHRLVQNELKDVIKSIHGLQVFFCLSCKHFYISNFLSIVKNNSELIRYALPPIPAIS